MIEAYLTLDNRRLDLADLTSFESSYLDRCVAAYERQVDWPAFSQLVEGKENPLLAATAGRVTRAVWDHPLYQAVRDLEDRLGVEQGCLTANPGDDTVSQPYSNGMQTKNENGVTNESVQQAARR